MLSLFVKTCFHTVAPGREAAKALMAIRQGESSVLDYADSGWNQMALAGVLLMAFQKELKTI